MLREPLPRRLLNAALGHAGKAEEELLDSCSATDTPQIEDRLRALRVVFERGLAPNQEAPPRRLHLVGVEIGLGRDTGKVEPQASQAEGDELRIDPRLEHASLAVDPAQKPGQISPHQRRHELPQDLDRRPPPVAGGRQRDLEANRRLASSWAESALDPALDQSRLRRHVDACAGSDEHAVEKSAKLGCRRTTNRNHHRGRRRTLRPGERLLDVATTVSFPLRTVADAPGAPAGAGQLSDVASDSGCAT